MQDYEKLGVFYLGKTRNPDDDKTEESLVLYDSKDLTTHAMIVGMTGSGKTGLALAMVEEAAIDGVPALLIDPKGDLGNLLLQFPELRKEDFRPWIDEGDALRKGRDPDEHAAATARFWREGLAVWGQDGDRIRRLLKSADFSVYTPGNTAVRPLRILKSFNAPPPDIAEDAAALRDRILFAVSGLLGLLGITEDPMQSREHILLSAILDEAWRDGRNVELETLIRAVQKPPFEQVGVFDLETFFPAKDRLKLAVSLNHLLASPGFSAWREGEPLDIEKLLYTPEGKPRATVLSIAHLGDAERMFFVTTLLNEVIVWMRRQAGTSSLRAMLYMDEIFGYFPPTANPPSKAPMLTLLKQARAYGLGIVLSTQNPVDLDYKGLGNCGTWFIGRLQTDRDKLRVLDGLEGSAASSGMGFDRAQTDRLLSGLGNRVFLMRNVHNDVPILFETRWVMSYLRGPLTLPQLRQLVPESANKPAEVVGASVASAPAAEPAIAEVADFVPHKREKEAAASSDSRPLLPPGLGEYFLRAPGGTASYRPAVTGTARLHFVDAKTATDLWETRTFLAPLDATKGVLWDEAELLEDPRNELDEVPVAGAGFNEIPPGAITARSAGSWSKGLAQAVYQGQTLSLLRYPELKMVSTPGEEAGAFRARLAMALREKRDAKVEKMKASYAVKIQRLSDQLRRAEERVEREKSHVKQQRLSTALSFGATILGALMGGRTTSMGTVTRATTAARSAGRIGRKESDVRRAHESAEVLQERLTDLENQFEQEMNALQSRIDPTEMELVEVSLRPRKSDIVVSNIGLCWEPV